MFVAKELIFVQIAIKLYKLTAADMGTIKSIKIVRGIREIYGEINSSCC